MVCCVVLFFIALTRYVVVDVCYGVLFVVDVGVIVCDTFTVACIVVYYNDVNVSRVYMYVFVDCFVVCVVCVVVAICVSVRVVYAILMLLLLLYCCIVVIVVVVNVCGVVIFAVFVYVDIVIVVVTVYTIMCLCCAFYGCDGAIQRLRCSYVLL